MRKGQLVTKRILGQKLEVEYLGRGRFTTAYAHDNEVYLFTKEDWAKEIMCLYCQNYAHIPVLKRLWYDQPTCIYQSIRYQPLTKQHSQAWELYKLLEKEWVEAWQYFDKMYGWCWHIGNNSGKDPIELCEHFVAEIEDKVSPGLYDTFDRLITCCANFSRTFLFEFKPKNLAVDDQGQLILLDPVYFLEQTLPKEVLAKWQ